MTTTTLARTPRADHEHTGRFRLHRAGILNVWQYDDQVFLFADGRMLLRGANGAGKSKTLEMLLPFVIDGDKARITASARHHTSLLWLMTDGYDGQTRVGYLWVEFLRPTADGEEAFTCGVGIRASTGARQATAWFFTTRQRIGHDLHLEDDGGPLSRPRLEEAIGPAGQVFEKSAAYKEHVGRALFGLGLSQYDEVLRLLYWLRNPQVGEDIEPARLAEQLTIALPQLDELAVKGAGETFDELTAYGEQIERRVAAAVALTGLAGAYAAYARGRVAARGRAVVDAVKELKRRRSQVRRRQSEHDELAARTTEADAALEAARQQASGDRGRIAELEASPAARDQRRLAELTETADKLATSARHAEERAAASAARHQAQAERHRQVTERTEGRIAEQLAAARALDVRQHESGVGCPVPIHPGIESTALDDQVSADRWTAALDAVRAGLGATEQATGGRRAAVRVVLDSWAQVAQARREVAAANERADTAERGWEEARTRRSEADRAAEVAAAQLWARIGEWLGEDGAPAFEAPELLTPDTVADLLPRARAAADPGLSDLRAEAQVRATVASRAQEQIDDLERQRIGIETEPDPAPPGPALPRTDRADGAGFWRVVDFAPSLDAADRAGLEAALQGSGLLDAWVRPDGSVLEAHSYDVVLRAGPALAGSTLADVLVADVPPGCDVTAATVDEIFRGIRLTDSADGVDEAVAVGRDGSWSLASLSGRATKQQAQYVGATARAQERERRLAEIETLLDAQRRVLAEAQREQEQLQKAEERLLGWLRRVPSAEAVVAAWALVGERRSVEDTAEGVNAAAQRAAREARAQASGAWQQFEALAASHHLPADAEGLRALDMRLEALGRDLATTNERIGAVLVDVDRWRTDLAALGDALQAAADDGAEARRQREERDLAANLRDELQRSLGASGEELRSRLLELRRSLASAEAAEKRITGELRELSGEVGSAEAGVRQAVAELEQQQAELLDALASFAAVGGVPGLLDSAFADGSGASSSVDVPLVQAAAFVEADQDLPARVADAARACAALSTGSDGGANVDGVNSVWQAYNEATSGPAADHEPVVAEFGDLVAVTGRDDKGELPIAGLAVRVTASVELDRELLTQREREQFEQHVLGEMGEAIRRCRTEAEDLVAAMNRLLGGVSTSQGLQVRLSWQLRDDVPAEAAEAVRLLAQPVGALLPHERATLRDALHRLIEVSRAENPGLSYGEHLAAALDYRTWSAFRIRYTRPEKAGQWLDLHRRSPLSEGEKKVLCYLPLFAAAAAHFESLAGAAPYAPRLVLLDDAFPKIDIRTHPLLFGLLVDLDLDFVITSERLWGDHETVPSLAIYEALRDPSQRGIAQFEFRWDGRQLHSLG